MTTRRAATTLGVAVSLLGLGMVPATGVEAPTEAFDTAGSAVQQAITLQDVYDQYPWMRSLRDYPRGSTPTY